MSVFSYFVGNDWEIECDLELIQRDLTKTTIYKVNIVLTHLLSKSYFLISTVLEQISHGCILMESIFLKTEGLLQYLGTLEKIFPHR